MRKTVIVAVAAFLSVISTGCRSGHLRREGVGLAPATGRSIATFAAFRSEKVLQAAMLYPSGKSAPVEQVPLSLTGSDGTGLRLVSLEAKAVVEGPLAFTELHMAFHNPENREREGRFVIALPPNAAISRFAMRLPDGWQEAEVVEKQKARQAYEDFLHRRQDPALMEKKAGNEFRARIFPIPANSNKEIIISYSQKLPSRNSPYRIFLKGLPRMERLEITAMVGESKVKGKRGSNGLDAVTLTRKVMRVSKRGFKPEADFMVKSESAIQGLANGDLALMRFAPEVSSPKAPLGALMVLMDTSASRAAGFHGQVAALGQVLLHLKGIHGKDVRLHVACFDQEVGSVYEGPIGSFGRRHMDLILARRALGASNLENAIAWASRHKGFKRLLVVTDGIATAGSSKGDALRESVKLLHKGYQRMDVMLSGGIRDEDGMRKLLTGVLEQDGVLLDGDGVLEEVARRISLRTMSNVKVAVPGAEWSWPDRLDGLQAGDEILVFAKMRSSAGKTSMRAILSGPLAASHEARLARVNRPLLERAWVEARIAHLEHQKDAGNMGPDLKEAVRRQIIELSCRHRVLSDQTALLVLETEADYARYSIKRTALADILVVGATGVEVAQRNKVLQIARPQPRPWRPVRPRRMSFDRALEAAKTAQSAPKPPMSKPAVQAPVVRRIRAESGAAAPHPAPMAPPSPELRRSSRFRMQRVAGEDHIVRRDEAERPEPPDQVKDRKPALQGKLLRIGRLIESGRIESALVEALRWRAAQPGDVLALVALGEALTAAKNLPLAARVYGSIVDLFPSRADMLRFAGGRLEALGRIGFGLAADAYKKAMEQRPDHASGYRALAMVYVRMGKLKQAFDVLEKGASRQYPISRSGVEGILKEDLGLVAAALLRRDPGQKADIIQRLKKLGVQLPERPSLRFVLTWETDANDVDFHIWDGLGGHASYRNKELGSGGSLYADVTNGYGPECFAIHGKTKGFPYRIKIHYYSKGPMGYGMGRLQILQHDGAGGLRFEDRPFVIMVDGAYVDLGKVKGPL